MGIKVYKNRETLKFPPYTNQGGKIAHIVDDTTANYVSDTSFINHISHSRVVSGMTLSTIGDNVVVSNGYYATSTNSIIKKDKPTKLPYATALSSVIGYKENIVPHGSPTIENYIIKNFSQDNYVTLPKVFQPISNTWEMKLAFKLNNYATCRIIGGYLTDDVKQGLVIGFGEGETLPEEKLSIWLSSTGDTWNIAAKEHNEDYIIQLNTWYYLLVKYDGEKYTMDISTSYDSGYTNLVTINDATPIIQWSPFMLGEYSAVNPFDGEINLANSYIKIGNDYFWKGREEIYESYVYCNDLTGDLELRPSEISLGFTYIGKVRYCDGKFIFVTPKYDMAESFENRFIVSELLEENGYRVYNDGYKEQWGYAANNASILFPITFNETPSASANASNITQSTMYVTAGYWFAEGY